MSCVIFLYSLSTVWFSVKQHLSSRWITLVQSKPKIVRIKIRRAKEKKTRKSKKHYELNAHATTSILNINICAKQAKHEKYVMAKKIYIFCNANNSGDTTTATGQRGKTKTSAKMFMDTRKERISLNKYWSCSNESCRQDMFAFGDNRINEAFSCSLLFFQELRVLVWNNFVILPGATVGANQK